MTVGQTMPPMPRLRGLVPPRVPVVADRRLEAPGWHRPLRNALVTLGCLGFLVWAARMALPHFEGPPIELRVAGPMKYVQSDEVAAALGNDLGAPLFALSLADARARVESLPWIERAIVSRAWPGRLSVRLWERIPAAHWNKTDLVSTGNAVFSPAPGTELPPGLPDLAGPDGSQARVREAFETLHARLDTPDLAPVWLGQDARGEWRARTRAGTELRFGTVETPTEALALLRGPVSSSLAGHWARVAYVDLRYSNGFAVGWRDGSGPDTTDNPSASPALSSTAAAPRAASRAAPADPDPDPVPGPPA